MELSTTTIVLAVLALAVGMGLGYLIRRLIADSRIRSAESKAQNILNEAKSKSQDLLLESKNKSLKILEESKQEGQERNAQLLRIEKMLSKKESELEIKDKELERSKGILKEKVENIAKAQEEIGELRKKEVGELEKISGLKKEEALKVIYDKVESEYKDDLYQKIKKMEEGSHDALERKAKEIMTTAIQR